MTSTDNKALLQDTLSLLQKVAEGIEKEHSWFKKNVDFSREIDGETIKHMHEHEAITAQEASEKLGEDNLVLKRGQVDTHINNLRLASVYVAGAVKVIQTVCVAKRGAVE